MNLLILIWIRGPLQKIQQSELGSESECSFQTSSVIIVNATCSGFYWSFDYKNLLN